MITAEEKLARGIELFNAGKAAEAAKLFKECAAAGGKIAENAALFLAHARAELSRDPEAAILPDDPAARALLEAAACGNVAALARAGRILFKANPSAAYRMWRDLWLSGTATAFGSAAAARSRSPWSPALRSSLEWAAGRDFKALALLSGPAKARETAWSRYFAAEILMRRLDLYDEAVQQCARVKRDCPWLWEASLLEAEARWSRGESPAPVLAPLAKLKPPASARASCLAWRGAMTVWAGKPSEALADLDESVAAKNHNASCWRGAARTMTGNLTGAISDLDTVIAADPGDDEAVIWRAEAKLKLGRRDDARPDLDLAAGRGALWAFALRARLALDEHRLDAARDDFAQLMPPVYEDVPDEGHTTDRGRHLGATVDLDAARLGDLLDEAFAAAGGVRRSDAHLNRAWMSTAGASPARRPAPGERLSAWWTLKGLACRPVEPADPADETRARKILR